MHVLLAEDDKRLGKLIVHMLRQECCTVDWVLNGIDACEYAAKSSPYDILILDWMMPKKDGVTVCRELRAKHYEGAILMLTAKDAVDDRVKGLDAGADDYLIKPFEFKELLARLRSLYRRTCRPLMKDILEAGDLRLDLRNYTVYRGEEEIQLTAREFQLLELLMINQGQTLPRELILDRIWGYDSDVTSNTLDAFIRLLRNKIGDNGPQKWIQNVRGVGYRLEP